MPTIAKATPAVAKKRTGTNIITAAGTLRWSAARVIFQPTPYVLRGLHLLHRCAVLSADKRPPDWVMTPEKAARAYDKALRNVFAHLLAVSADTRLAVLRQLLDQVQEEKSFGGLDSLFFSLMHTAGRRNKKKLFDRGAALWRDVGAPKRLGAGRVASVMVNLEAGRIALIDTARLAALAPGGSHEKLLRPGYEGGIFLPTVQIPIVSDIAAFDGVGFCKTAFQTAGGVCGALLSSPSGPGAALGTAAGTMVGALAGELLCDDIVSEINGSSSGAGAGGAGGAGAGGAGQGGAGETGSVDNVGTEGPTGGTSNDDEEGGVCEDTSADSSGDDTGGEDDSGGGDDDDDGMPSPDDNGGGPSSIIETTTYATGAGVATHVAHVGKGAWTITGLARLDATGRLVEAGALAAIPKFADMVDTTSVGDQVTEVERIDVERIEAERIAAETIATRARTERTR